MRSGAVKIASYSAHSDQVGSHSAVAVAMVLWVCLPVGLVKPVGPVRGVPEQELLRCLLNRGNNCFVIRGSATCHLHETG